MYLFAFESMWFAKFQIHFTINYFKALSLAPRDVCGYNVCIGRGSGKKSTKKRIIGTYVHFIFCQKDLKRHNEPVMNARLTYFLRRWATIVDGKLEKYDLQGSLVCVHLLCATMNHCERKSILSRIQEFGWTCFDKIEIKKSYSFNRNINYDRSCF